LSRLKYFFYRIQKRRSFRNAFSGNHHLFFLDEVEIRLNFSKVGLLKLLGHDIERFYASKGKVFVREFYFK